MTYCLMDTSHIWWKLDLDTYRREEASLVGYFHSECDVWSRVIYESLGRPVADLCLWDTWCTFQPGLQQCTVECLWSEDAGSKRRPVKGRKIKPEGMFSRSIDSAHLHRRNLVLTYSASLIFNVITDMTVCVKAVPKPDIMHHRNGKGSIAYGA